MALSGEMQAYCDIEGDMVKGVFGTIVQVEDLFSGKKIDGDRKESEEKVGKSNCEECEYIKNMYVFWWTGFLYRRIKLTL